MNPRFWLLIAVYFAVLALLAVPLGRFLARVFAGENRLSARVLGPVERWLYRLAGVDPEREHGWKEYAAGVLGFSLVTQLISYAVMRAQGSLPFNPTGLSAVPEWLAFNTATSFTTNTNWQSYAGESTVSSLSQAVALTSQNFFSAGVGICVAIALIRGIARAETTKLGNFWVDLVRVHLYVLLPISLLYALFLVSQGVIQTWAGPVSWATLDGGTQSLLRGPVASQEAIKMLGTNGGGFFNANSAHPFENPTPFTNFLQMVMILAIPTGLTYTFGRMARNQRQGWAIFAAMAVLFLIGVSVAYAAESSPNPALAGLGVDQGLGNVEGKEVRFGVANSALFATVTTDASCGAVNAMHDSFTPLGGLVPLANIMLGEVIFGGVGAGLYGILVMVLLSVFIAGLMVGRTPEYLGKKIETREMKAAMLYVLVFPLIILGLAGWAAVAGPGTSSLNNAGPHGLSEILYAFTSGTGNNGSAFAGLNANTPFYNVTLGLAMLGGRFLMIVPALAIAGSMLTKKTVTPGPGTFPTNGPLFAGLLVAVVLIVGALTFFPALSLGPIAEHFVALAGKTY
jgi:potassium-transporting ATPase potassium-binding subunit